MAGHVLTGTWEEVSGHASELAGKTIVLTVLTEPSPETALLDTALLETAASALEDTRDALRRIMARQAGVRETAPATFGYRDGSAQS